MTIEYLTDELLFKNLTTRLKTVSTQNQPTKPKVSEAPKAPKAKVQGFGSKPPQPKTFKPVNSAAPAPAVSKAYTVEEIEKMGLAGIGGIIAGGLGRAKAAMPRFKQAGATALGPGRTAQVKGLGSKIGARYSNVSPAGGKWNKKLIARDAGLAAAGTAAIGGTGYLLAKAEKTEEEKRLRDIRIGTASNVFGAGMGALATYQAADAGRRKYREHAAKVKQEGYKPKTKTGARINEAMKGKKLSGKMAPLVIAGGAAGGAAGQAINGLMDANSARVFINEDRKLVGQMAVKRTEEEGLVKSVEVPAGNGFGTNLSKSWHGSNPDATEIGLVSIGNAYRIAHPDDPEIERKRKKRNTTGAAVSGAGLLGGVLAGKKASDDLRALNAETKNLNTSRLADMTAGQRVGDSARQLFTRKGLKESVDAKSKLLGNQTLSAQYGHIHRPDQHEQQKARQQAWKQDTNKRLSSMQRKMGRGATLAALGAGVAYAGNKMRTD